MRLFLSSYRAGAHKREFLELLGQDKEVAFISNAKDYYPPDIRKEKMNENFDYWRSVGIKPTEIDLRPFFHKSGAEKVLEGHKCVWMMGGNVFLLRRALAYTGLDNFLVKKIRDGEFIYGGESAGAIIAGPTLKYSEMDTDEDSPSYIPKMYDIKVIWVGLNLVDFVPVPHYQTPDYCVEIQAYIDKLDEAKLSHEDLTDEQAIVIDGNKMEFLK